MPSLKYSNVRLGKPQKTQKLNTIMKFHGMQYASTAFPIS